MEYTMKKVAITGGTGGVGLALIRKLLTENVEILLFQRPNSERENYLPKSELLHIVYCDLEELGEYVVKEKDYDVFFHLGWAFTQKDKRSSIKLQNRNIDYACEAVELAYRLGCHTFIGAGSQAEYGRHNEVLREDTVCHPENAYGIAKLCSCYETRIICNKLGIRHIWTRILSAYGIYDNVNSMLVSTVLKSMSNQSLEFTRGEQIWDFLYLDDLANALYMIGQKGRDGAIYPLGSGKSRELKEYITVLCEKLGKMGEMKLGAIPYSGKEVMHLEADISKVKADTGWEPQVDFEEGIERVIRFYENNNELVVKKG